MIDERVEERGAGGSEIDEWLWNAHSYVFFCKDLET